MQAGATVVLVARGEHGRVIGERGLELQLADRVEMVPAECASSICDVSWQPSDIVLLTTKLQDARDALDALLAAAGPDVPVVCVTNGVHGERWAVERFRTVLSTLVWLPATYLVPGQVRVHSAGCLGVLDTGPAKGDDELVLTKIICEDFVSAGFDAKPRVDIARWKAAKLITNLSGAAQALIQDGWLEVAEVAREEGERVLDAARPDRVPTVELLARCKRVREVPVAGAMRGGGSAWQSMQRGTSLESPWLEGAVAEYAEQAGLCAPINAALADAARQLRPCTAAEILSGRDEDAARPGEGRG